MWTDMLNPIEPLNAMSRVLSGTFDSLSTDMFVTGNPFERFVKHVTSLKGVVECDVSGLTMFPHDNVVLAFYGHTSAYEGLIAIPALSRCRLFGHNMKALLADEYYMSALSPWYISTNGFDMAKLDKMHRGSLYVCIEGSIHREETVRMGFFHIAKHRRADICVCVYDRVENAYRGIIIPYGTYDETNILPSIQSFVSRFDLDRICVNPERASKIRTNHPQFTNP
jgi:hypothetical protein